MKSEDVFDALDSLRVITGETHMVVVGSQSLHGMHPGEADTIMVSREVDVMLMNRAKLANWISEVVGAGTPFEIERGYFIDHVNKKPDFPVLADGWEERVIRSDKVPKCVVDFIAPADLAIAKLGAGRDKDFQFIIGMLNHKLITIENIVDLIPLVSDTARERVLASFEQLQTTLETGNALLLDNDGSNPFVGVGIAVPGIRYVGPIKDIQGDFMLQSIGRGKEVVHRLCDLKNIDIGKDSILDVMYNMEMVASNMGKKEPKKVQER